MQMKNPAQLCILSLIFLLLACSTVPITGRQQLSLVSSGTLNSMSFQQYREFLSRHKVVKGTADAAMVGKVGRRIQEAVEGYCRAHNLSSRLEGYQWEFNLIDDPEVNAWCMPGGKVVVYTGILPVTRDEAGLATVIGHEVAHAVANHGNERMSQGLLINMGGITLGTALSTQPVATQKLFSALYGVGSQVGLMLPYSRLQESEADRLGLIFMAMAGYDPNSAIPFMERLKAADKNASPPQFLSTHPADSTRINAMRQVIPEAMRYYTKTTP
jgi:predicted Zn-dependent protease